MSNMLGSPETSVAFVSLSGTRPSPLKKKIFLNSYEDELVTAVVAVLLTGMFLAYLCLCCHVWGLHIRLLQLIKSLRPNENTNQSNRRTGANNRPPVSVPLVGRSQEDYLTPPPRYSLVNNSLPTYSCAFLRMLGLLKGPVQLRILVYVDPRVRGELVDNGPVESQFHVESLNEVFTSVDCTNQPKPDTSKEGMGATAAACSSLPSDGNLQLSESFERMFSDPYEASSSEHSADQSSISETSSVQSLSTDCSNENNPLPVPIVPVNEDSYIPQASGTFNNPVYPKLDDSSTTVTVSGDDMQESSCSLSPDAITSNCQDSKPPEISTDISVEVVSPGSNELARQDSDRNIVIPNEPENHIRIVSSEADNEQTPLESNDSASPTRTRSPDNSIKLLMKGIGGSEQVVYAHRSSANCYVANWPLPPRDTLDSDSLEVLVDGEPVEDIYLEFLNVDGRRVGLTQLQPSPRPSENALFTSATVNISPFPSSSIPQFSPQPVPVPSPFVTTSPPPYRP
ncbi:hypothetical protein SK128_019902 [Halocaridina rubra]|uniref:Uncharacterized protein n=1 Tax=Halocaridina rubra TaxID=373956 RepID=A0AAN9A4I3_HALRR